MSSRQVFESNEKKVFSKRVFQKPEKLPLPFIFSPISKIAEQNYSKRAARLDSKCAICFLKKKKSP
jgi:hypothetical protein